MRALLILLVCLVLSGCTGEQPGHPVESPSTPVPSQSPTDDPKFTQLREDLWEVDVRGLVRLSSPADLEQRRLSLLESIWGDSGRLRQLRPTRAVEVGDSVYSGLPEVASVERLEIEQEYGLTSIANHLRPTATPSGQLVIYHGGHEAVSDHLDIIQALLAEGHSVVAMDMPLCGRNPTPLVEVPGRGPIWLLLHDQLWLLPGEGSAQRFFLGPVAAVVNHLENEYDRISMAGFSGGGWLTTVYAAADPRIVRSYPVAGSLPLFLRNWVPEAGDHEQWDPAFFGTTNYLELYVLGATGKGRRQTQILNQYDGWTFYGIRWKVYQQPLADLIQDLGVGGEFKVLVDTKTREHALTPAHIEWILEDLRSDD